MEPSQHTANSGSLHISSSISRVMFSWSRFCSLLWDDVSPHLLLSCAQLRRFPQDSISTVWRSILGDGSNTNDLIDGESQRPGLDDTSRARTANIALSLCKVQCPSNTTQLHGSRVQEFAVTISQLHKAMDVTEGRTAVRDEPVTLGLFRLNTPFLC